MKELFNYCYQPRAYADSSGYCLVELEEGETIKDVLKEYIVPKDWFEQQYLNAKEITEYKHKEKTYSGRLVLMNTSRVYLD